MAEALGCDVQLNNVRGLHARAAAKIVTLVQKFEAQVTISTPARSVEATSIVELLLLGAKMGSVLHIACEGPDADQAIQALRTLIEGKFGESA